MDKPEDDTTLVIMDQPCLHAIKGPSYSVIQVLIGASLEAIHLQKQNLAMRDRADQEKKITQILSS